MVQRKYSASSREASREMDFDEVGAGQYSPKEEGSVNPVHEMVPNGSGSSLMTGGSLVPEHLERDDALSAEVMDAVYAVGGKVIFICPCIHHLWFSIQNTAPSPARCGGDRGGEGA